VYPSSDIGYVHREGHLDCPTPGKLIPQEGGAVIDTDQGPSAAQHLQQLGEVRRHAAGLVAGQQLGR